MFDGHYLDWNQKRIKCIVDHYGHQFFYSKKVLDLGCGHADIGGVLYRLGSDVTIVDARQEHLKVASKKYSGIKTVRADLDQPWPFFGKFFDLVLDMGLLNHLKDIEAHLKSVCASTNYLILETSVLDSNDPELSTVKPDSKNIYDGSFNGFSSQMTAARIEKLLRDNGMQFERVDNSKLNCGAYRYDWTVNNTKLFDNNNRRLWFCYKQGQDAVGTSSNVGAFSPHALTDTKIPITHQQLIVTKSPTPPNSAKPMPVVTDIKLPDYRPPHPASIVGHKKTRLFYNYYEDKNPTRKAEIDSCLNRNIDVTLFDIIIIESSSNPTFNFMFEKINKLAGPEDISIICNADIFFDNTISLSQKIGPDEVFALTRWEHLRDNFATLSDNFHNQDVWIVRGQVKNVNGDFQMGMPGCDGRIAHEFQVAGYKVINPSKSIKTFHLHKSGVRNHTNEDTVPGPYLYVEPTDIK